LISDVNPTLGTRESKRIVSVLDHKKNPADVTRIFAFGLGSDAMARCCRHSSEPARLLARARETEDITSALKIFFSTLAARVVEGLRLEPVEGKNFYQVYATGDYTFDGSSLAFVGRYHEPTRK